SERELCEQFRVSRITVRHTLHQLVTEGRLVRIHGRGTYVASSPLKKQLLPLVGFSEDMLSRGQRPGARVLRFETGAASLADAQLLDLRTGSPTLHIQRTTYDLQGRPFEYLESFFRGDKYVYYAELGNDVTATGYGTSP